MPTRNAPFYSRRPGDDQPIRSHRKYSAALKAASELGQIWLTDSARQRQVHMSAAGSWMTVKPDEFLAVDLRQQLIEQSLIDPPQPDTGLQG